MKRCYLSKNYKEVDSGGNKAKTDMERIMSSSGFVNVGLPQTRISNAVIGYIMTLLSVLKAGFCLGKGDLLVLQYPLKKYYTFVCKVAHLRGAKVITLIHDLGAFRRKKLTVAKEKKRLSHTDYVIALNESMKAWLIKEGYQQPIGCLEIWDYLSTTEAAEQTRAGAPYRIVYASGLSYKKNKFLYEVDNLKRSWHFNLYGKGFEWDRIKNKEQYTYKGFVCPDELLATVDGDFGLIWDGNSVTTCSGSFGEYLRYNNPHKTSLYLRCYLPVIIWEKAAIAGFIREHKIGICIESLADLDKVLNTISPDDYLAMKERVKTVSHRLSTGYYFMKAYQEAEKILTTHGH